MKITHNGMFLAVVAALPLTVVGALSGTAFAQEVEAPEVEVEPRPLLIPRAGGVAALQVVPPAEAKRIAAVTVDIEALRELTVQQEFTLQLYDREYRLVVDRRQASKLNTTIVGHFADDEDWQFAIAIVEDAVAGHFSPPGNVPPVHLRYGGPGVHYLHEFDYAQLPDCSGSPKARKGPNAAPPVAPDELQAEMEELMREALGGTDGTCSPLPDSYFDILVVYTTLAKNAAGSTNAVRAAGVLGVEEMTTSLLNSNLAAQARVVWYLEVSYNESGDYGDHLDRLTSTSDGIMDNVHGVRAGCEADFVCLLVADTGQTGLGWCDAGHDDAFSVSRWDVAGNNFTLAHEVGHNLGCAHNPEDADCEPYANAYGHHFDIGGGDRAHTVMSYSVNNSERIRHYSAPAINFMGVPTGTESRNNRNRINLRRVTCSNFRLTRMDVWVEFGGGGGVGSYSLPYNNLATAISRIQPDGQFLPQLPILHIKEGSGGSPIEITKAMEIRSCGGTVTIGQ